MPRHGRRTFLKATGAAVTGSALFAGGAAADGDGGAGGDRFIVDLTEVSRSAVPSDVEIVHDLAQIDVLVARGDADRVGDAAATLPDLTVAQHGPAVERDANPEEVTPGFASENPPLTERQWDKRAQELGDLDEHPGTDGASVHDVTEGEGTRVAVIDTGIYDAHPDLEVNGDRSANFTEDPDDWRPNGAGDHGTHVAGTVAATTGPDGNGVVGTAPSTELVSFRVFSGEAGAGGDVLAAIVAAGDAGCDAANLSLGIPYATIAQLPRSVVEQYAQLYGAAVAYARGEGTVVVNSAGNSGLDLDPADVFTLPTALDGTFAVSATGPIGYMWGKGRNHSHNALAPGQLDDPVTEPAFYTNYGGSSVDVSAAGGNIDRSAADPDAANDLVFSTIYRADEETGEPVPGYGWKAGTSMAAPQVSGAVALARSLRPDASVAEVEDLIRETASTPEEGEKYHGDGHLDVPALVDAAAK